MNNYSKYLKVCQEAVKNEDIFKIFRSHVEYVAIVENCAYLHGLGCIEEIKKEFPYLLRHISRFITSDEIGNPAVFYYKEIDKTISPTTLRYIKILGDLMNLFGKLDDMNIIEIGGGYGGQCKIIYDIAQPHSYTIVDLPEALKLSEKYLRYFGIKNIKFKTSDNVFDNLYSLCISNYAFSEVSYDYQKMYAEKIVKYSDRGYMIWNHFSKKRTCEMHDLEILKAKDGKFTSERPLTGINNILYTWNHTVK